MFPALAVCKPCTDPRQIFAGCSKKKGIYLDLVDLRQADGICGISLLATTPSCSSGPLVAQASGTNAPAKSNITQNYSTELLLSLTQIN